MSKIKLLIEIDEELYKNVVEHTKLGYVGSDLWIAASKGTPYNPSGDAISREALKEQINATDFDFGDYYDNTEEIRKRVCEAIDNAQAIPLPNEQVAWEQGYEAGLAQGKHRPKGKWLFKHNSSDIWCSVCDENFDEIPQAFNFCPNCGADMRTKENKDV